MAGHTLNDLRQRKSSCLPSHSILGMEELVECTRSLDQRGPRRVQQFIVNYVHLPGLNRRHISPRRDFIRLLRVTLSSRCPPCKHTPSAPSPPSLPIGHLL